ncbi:MAG TPA: tetratricopeptide repeat protein [Bryobacteraceae bacterium]
MAQAQVQQQPATTKPVVDKAAAYYYFTLAHYYAESLAQNGNRGDVLNRAIENYKLAIKADPTASFVSEELSDVYVQSGRIREAVSDAEDALKANPNDLGSRRILARLYTRLISDGNQNRINEDMLKKAIEQYQKIAQADPTDMDTLLVLGRLYKVSGNSPDSEKIYKQALAIDPNNEDALTGLAVVYSDLGDTKQAAEMLRKASDKNPTPRNLYQLAAAYEQMRDYSMAAQAMRRAVELNPPNVSEFKRQLGRLQIQAEQLDDALATFQNLVSEEPNDADSWLRISQIYRQKHDFVKAREAGTKARAIDATNLEIKLNDVALLVDEGKTDQAIDLLKGMVDQTPKRGTNPSERANRIQLLERLGVLYRSVDKTDEAVDAFRQIAAVDSDLSAKVEAQVVETYRQGKDFAKADKESESAMQKYPDDRLVIMTRATVLSDMGKFDQAISVTKKLLTGKDDRETYITLAQLYEKAKKFDDMAKALDEADKLNISKDDQITTNFMRGSMYERQKKYDQAEAEFRKVLVDDPENASALNYLGYMMADRNSRLNEALDLINRALKKEPGNGAYLDSLGWVYYRMNRLQEAEDTLRTALDKMMAKDPTVHDHLGDVYMKEGKLREAIQQWEGSIHEYENGAPADLDHAEVAKVQKKLETAKVRLAKENGKQKN